MILILEICNKICFQLIDSEWDSIQQRINLKRWYTRQTCWEETSLLFDDVLHIGQLKMLLSVNARGLNFLPCLLIGH